MICWDGEEKPDCVFIHQDRETREWSGHKFHERCLRGWFEAQQMSEYTQSCPVCRRRGHVLPNDRIYCN